MKLEKSGFTLFWPFGENVAKEERRNIARKALLADIFLSDSNALTTDGEKHEILIKDESG